MASPGHAGALRCREGRPTRSGRAAGGWKRSAAAEATWPGRHGLVAAKRNSVVSEDLGSLATESPLG